VVGTGCAVHLVGERQATAPFGGCGSVQQLSKEEKSRMRKFLIISNLIVGLVLVFLPVFFYIGAEYFSPPSYFVGEDGEPIGIHGESIGVIGSSDGPTVIYTAS
jgi:hypothetical protein